MTVGAPPESAALKHRKALEEARRLAALQVDTLAHAVTDIGDEVGWSRLTELGTASTVRAQQASVSATTELLSSTLDAVGMVGDIVDLPGIQPGRLASGKDVRGMFAQTQRIVQARMAAGATFPEGLDASATVLTSIASSEPHRIGRDGQLAVGLSDERFGKFRRVAVGTTCAFCRMLATRGAVYLTAEKAGKGRQYHYRCDCYVELVVDPDAIEASKGLQKDWRNAIKDPARLDAAKARREFEALTDEQLAQLAKTPANARSADLAAELARREALAAMPAPSVMPKSAPVPEPPAAVKLDADSVQRLKNADLEAEMKSAWDREDWDSADILEAEVDRRQKWADGWGRDFDDYDDFHKPGLSADDADSVGFDDIPEPPKMTRREVRAQWDAEQDLRYFEAEQYGGGILPELQAEAASKGITMQTLMTGDPRIAYKYANQELLQWWADNGGRMPLWEREAAHGILDARTSAAQRALTESKARARAEQLLGKNRREAVARINRERRAERARRA